MFLSWNLDQTKKEFGSLSDYICQFGSSCDPRDKEVDFVFEMLRSNCGIFDIKEFTRIPSR